MASVGSRPAATTRGPARSWRSASTSTRNTVSTRPTSIVVARRRFPRHAGRAPALRARLRSAPPPRAGRSDEPALRRSRAMPTSTGSRADHRLPLQAERDRAASPASLAAAVGVRIAQPGTPARSLRHEPRRVEKWIAAVAKDLQAHRGASLVIAGDGQPPAVHALAHAMNEALGNVGRTVIYTEPVEGGAGRPGRIAARAGRRHERGHASTCWSSSAATRSTRRRRISSSPRRSTRCTLRVHLSLYDDETSELCHWQIPEAHFLEAWSDARALRRDGVDRPAAHRAALRRQVGARSCSPR